MKRGKLPELAAEIGDELQSLASLVETLRETVSQIPGAGPTRQVYIESVALKLHNLYTGCERIFERIATDLDGGLPMNVDWHRRLLHSMALDVPGVRPPVIGRSTRKALEELLAFRHVVRNIYGYELDGGGVAALAGRADAVFATLRSEVERFCGFLKDLAG